jgi:hypothetical protein
MSAIPKPTPLLAGELAAVRGELTRLDAKCGTLVSLALAATAFLSTQVGHGPVVVRVLFGLAGLPLAAATLVLLLAVLRPRLGSTGFCQYATQDTQQIRDHFHAPKTATGQASETAQITDLRILSRIAYGKYTQFRRAVDLTAAGVAVIGLALIAAVIA